MFIWLIRNNQNSAIKILRDVFILNNMLRFYLIFTLSCILLKTKRIPKLCIMVCNELHIRLLK